MHASAGIHAVRIATATGSNPRRYTYASANKTLVRFELTILDAQAFFDRFKPTEYEEAVAGRVWKRSARGLRYLVEVGLDYLTLTVCRRRSPAAKVSE